MTPEEKNPMHRTTSKKISTYDALMRIGGVQAAKSSEIATPKYSLDSERDSEHELHLQNDKTSSYLTLNNGVSLGTVEDTNKLIHVTVTVDSQQINIILTVQSSIIQQKEGRRYNKGETEGNDEE